MGNHILLSSLWFIVLLNGINSFQCYICSTMVNGNACRNLSKGAYTQLCQGGACLTRHNFDGSVQRDCGISSFGNTCQNIAGAKVCYCTTDKCNGDNGSNNSGNRSYGRKNSPYTMIILVLGILGYFMNIF